MAKTNAIRRRTEARQQAQRLSTEEVDELLGELPPEEATRAVANPLAPNFVPIAPAPELPLAATALEVPLAPYRPEVRQFSHVDVALNPAQGRTLRRLFDALDQKHARLGNGRHVASPADCVRWLLDELAGGS